MCCDNASWKMHVASGPRGKTAWTIAGVVARETGRMFPVTRQCSIAPLLPPVGAWMNQLVQGQLWSHCASPEKQLLCKQVATRCDTCSCIGAMRAL